MKLFDEKDVLSEMGTAVSRVGLNNGDNVDTKGPESRHLLLGRSHIGLSSIPSLSFPNDITLISLLSHKIFRRAEGCPERSGVLLLNTLSSISSSAPSVAVTAPTELFTKEQRVNEVRAWVICTREPPHEQAGYFAASGVERRPSELLKVPVSAQSPNEEEKDPLRFIKRPCVDVSGAAWSGVFVTFVSVVLRNESVNEETALARERKAGCAHSQRMLEQLMDENERDEVEEDNDVCMDATKADDDERVMSLIMIFVNVTIPPVCLVTLGHVREIMVQLFIVTVAESIFNSVQFNRMESSVTEVIVQPLI